MLPAARRLTRSTEFAAVLGTGRRGSARRLAVHVLRTDDPRPARAGLVVSSKVGNSVIRHRVSRRLRAELRPLLAVLPTGSDVVVRAFPAAAEATSTDLRADLNSGLRKCGVL